jgi:putative transcription factor
MAKPRRTVRDVDIEYEYVDDLGAVVRNARMRLGISQAELANLVKERETIIKKIEQGEFNPPLDLVRRLEKVLKVSLLQVVAEETPKPKITQPPITDTYTLEDLLKKQQEKPR